MKRAEYTRRPSNRTRLSTYVQQNQPPDVPPLELTGERTLPDVPEENYWYRRHLAVYRWIAARCAGRRLSTWRAVRDTAAPCSPKRRVRRRRRREPGGARARPAALRGAASCASSGRSSRTSTRARLGTRSSSSRRSSTSPSRGRCWSGSRSLLAPGGVAYISTPNRLTLAPPGAERSGNPWHVREYTRRRVPRSCSSRTFSGVELLGLFHARKLRLHELALRARLGPGAPAPRPDRALLRQVRAGDRRARLRAAAGAGSTARSTSSRSAGREPPERRRRALHRPACAHALRRGLRHLAVRRGVAARGDRRLVPVR